MKRGLIVFAFGAPGNLESNQILKSIALAFVEQYASITQIYTQEASGIVTKDFESINYAKRHTNGQDKELILSIIAQSNANNHPPTLRIARWAVEKAVQAGVEHLIVIAAAPHLSRCLRDVRYALKEHKLDVAAATEAQPILDIPNDMWYSVISDQPRTRSPFQWWSREWMLLAMPMWLYAKVAG